MSNPTMFPTTAFPAATAAMSTTPVFSTAAPLAAGMPKSNNTPWMLLGFLLVVAIVTGVYMYMNKKEIEEAPRKPIIVPVEEEIVTTQETEAPVETETETETETPETETETPVETETPEPADEQDTAVNKQKCVYLGWAAACSARCGEGKLYRTQVPYDPEVHTSHTPHDCVADEDRPFKPCTGIICDETYTLSAFREQFPDKTYAEYCEWIVENDACYDPAVTGPNVCGTQCKRV
jgi:hypothetical protein